MREGQFCFNCKHRSNPEMSGGCTYSESKDRPIRGNDTDSCCFSPSKWEPRPEYGKLVVGIPDPDPYPPGAGEIRSDPPEPDGYSMVCRGIIKFFLKDGLCYSADEEKRYLGKLEDLFPEPSEDEIQKVLNWHKNPDGSPEPTENEIQRVLKWAKDKHKLT